MIEFSCPHCGKLLFARDDYARRRGPCPACASVIAIPASTAEATRPPMIERVIDMELGPEPNRIARPVAPAQAALPIVPTPDAGSASAADDPRTEFSRRFDAELPPPRASLGGNPPPAATQTSVPVAAAASPELHAQNLEEHERLARLKLLAMFERNVNIWRSFSIIATSFTIGWLFYLTVTYAFQPEPPWPAIIFSCTLIFGLWRASREMKNGPHMMFIAAAIAMIVCMPINLKLGMPNISEMLESLKSSRPEGPTMTREDLQNVMLVLCTFAGLVFSIPLWITSLKVAGLQRMRATIQAAERSRSQS